MDTTVMMQQYWYYRENLKKLAALKLTEVASVRKFTRGVVQAAYKQMRDPELWGEKGFTGTLTDYLCWISLRYVVHELKRKMKSESSMTDWAKAIVDNYDEYKVDIKNMLRVFSDYPYFFTLLRRLLRNQTGNINPLDEWGTTDEMKDQNRSNALLTVLFEQVLYEEETGKRREDYLTLIDDAKQMVS